MNSSQRVRATTSRFEKIDRSFDSYTWLGYAWLKRKKRKKSEERKVFKRANRKEERNERERERERDREDNGNIEILDHRYDDVVRNFGNEPISS